MGLENSHILLIDDDEEMRSLLSEYLCAHGCQLTMFTLAKDAYKEFLQGGCFFAKRQADAGINLIISDVNMPEMDGLKFTEKLKEIFPDLPVILITAFWSRRRRDLALEKGAFECFSKPFTLKELKHTIETALQNTTQVGHL